MATRKKEIPQETKELKPMPAVGIAENMVRIGDEMIEIKPTKLRYQRDMTANFYKALEMYPLPEILSWDENVIGDGRTGDKAVMDWQIAVTDNAQIVRKYYNDMDTSTIETLLEIFKRINRISEKEDRIKNALREKAKA